MVWLLFAVVQFLVIVAGIQRERRAGLWQWSKFFFSLAFAALECIVLIVPLTMIDMHGPYFAPVLTVAILIAVGNFVWFIIACRRWKLPDGRTSLEAYRDAQRK